MAHAFLFNVFIELKTSSISSSFISPCLIAARQAPVPSGLVSIIISPSLAAAFVVILLGLAKPTTAIPYFTFVSVIVCPPTTNTPASVALSCPPFNMLANMFNESSLGNIVIFNASLGSPPIAYISLIALHAAI